METQGLTNNREKMKKKTIYTEEELMQLSKEFLVSTILRLEEQKNFWLDRSFEISEQRRKDIEELWDLINKK